MRRNDIDVTSMWRHTGFMDLEPYLSRIAVDLDRVTSLADDQTREISRRLAVALEPGLRLAMTELLSDAAADLSARLGGAVITVRMDGQEPVLQVSDAPVAEPIAPPGAVSTPLADDVEDGTARVTVRLPDALKRRAETLAQQARQSLNAWIVDAIRAATDPGRHQSTTRTGRRLSGWA